ncbi:MAG: type II CAAX endopeptidase family protein [Terriglobales bacterium]
MDSNLDPEPILPPENAPEDCSVNAGGVVSEPTVAALSQPEPLPSPWATATVRRESALSPLAEMFVGPEGLYPGARWLIYIVMGLVVLGVLNSVFYGLQPRLGGSLWWMFAGEARLMLAALVPGFVMARVEGHAFGEFGLPARGAFGRNFWTGALWGIVALTVLMVIFRAVGVFSFGSIRLHGARILRVGLFYAVFFLMVAFFEDFLMRGYSQWVLAKGMNFWPAAGLLSIVFGAMHGGNPGEDPVGLAAVVLIGLFFCLTLWRTGTLWWAVGFHMAWDWGESFFYSVPDSGNVARGRLLSSSFHGPAWLTGGSVGPEASYLIFVLLAALWVLFSRVYPEVKYGAREIDI